MQYLRYVRAIPAATIPDVSFLPQSMIHHEADWKEADSFFRRKFSSSSSSPIRFAVPARTAFAKSSGRGVS